MVNCVIPCNYMIFTEIAMVSGTGNRFQMHKNYVNYTNAIKGRPFVAGLSLSLPAAALDVFHDLDAGSLLLQFFKPREGFTALLALVGFRQFLHFRSVLV